MPAIRLGGQATSLPDAAAPARLVPPVCRRSDALCWGDVRYCSRQHPWPQRRQGVGRNRGQDCGVIGCAGRIGAGLAGRGVLLRRSTRGDGGVGPHLAKRPRRGGVRGRVVLAALSLVIMPSPSWARRRTGRALGSATVVATTCRPCCARIRPLLGRTGWPAGCLPRAWSWPWPWPGRAARSRADFDASEQPEQVDFGCGQRLRQIGNVPVGPVR